MLHAVATLLKASDPHMLRAMDGNKTTHSVERDDANLPSRNRTEPALYFWTTFGLAFEALCASPPSGSTPASTVQSIALEAVVGLIRPDIAGTALKDSGLFEEVCNLCYRLAITEGLEIKMRVLEIALGLSRVFLAEAAASSRQAPAPETSAGSAEKALTFPCEHVHSANGAVDHSSIRNDPRLTQCLRVATTALREAIPATSSSAKREFSLARSVNPS